MTKLPDVVKALAQDIRIDKDEAFILTGLYFRLAGIKPTLHDWRVIKEIRKKTDGGE